MANGVVSGLLLEVADLSQRPSPPPADESGITGTLPIIDQVLHVFLGVEEMVYSLLLNAEEQGVQEK